MSIDKTSSAIYFITGSSGSGKTTLLNGIKGPIYPGLRVYHFDDLGVPSIEEMNARYGGPEQWQAHNTRRWVEKVAHQENAELVVLDGQARPSVILEAARETGLVALHITLIDCSHVERRNRLIGSRSQPELDHLDMYAWAAYLRGQADALGLEIIDTTGKSLAESISELAGSIRLFAEENEFHLERQDGTTGRDPGS